jgi:hypothetical protein
VEERIGSHPPFVVGQAKLVLDFRIIRAPSFRHGEKFQGLAEIVPGQKSPAHFLELLVTVSVGRLSRSSGAAACNKEHHQRHDMKAMDQ